MSAVYEAEVRATFVTKGENDQVNALRKAEQAQQAVRKTTEAATKATKAQTAATAAARGPQEGAAKSAREVAASSEKQRREMLEAAAVARKNAAAADLSTKTGQRLARQQLDLAQKYSKAAASIERQDKAQDKASASTRRAAESSRKAETATEKATAAVRAQDSAQDKAAASSRRYATSNERSAKSLDRARSAARRMFAALGAGYVAYRGISTITKQTVEFDRSLRNVNSIAQLSERGLGRVNKRLLEMSGKVVQAPRTLAEGMYDLVSSGFQGSKALTVLRSSAKAATAGLTTTEVSTKAVAAVLNAYRLGAGKAKDVSDVLFRIVDRGVISFQELAGTIGDVLPFASSLGVDLRQVGGSIATMTKAGVSAPETMTRVKNTMVTLLKPGQALKDTIEDLGYASGEQIVKQRGFQGALTAVVGATNGTKAAVARLFPNIRALSGVLSLTGANTRRAAEDLTGMKSAGGATARALGQQSQSIYQKWQKLKVQSSKLAIEWGERLVPTAGKLMDVLSSERLTLDQKLERTGDIAGKVVEKISDRLPKLIESTAPQIAEAGGHLSIALAEGMVKGFTHMGLLGQLFTVAALTRMVGGRGALLAAGRGLGSVLGVGVSQGVASSAAAAGPAGGIAGSIGRSAGRGGYSTYGLARSFGRGRLSSGLAAAGAGVGVAGSAIAGSSIAQSAFFSAAAIVQMKQAADALTYFGRAAKDPIDRLDQLNEKAGTWQATVSSLGSDLADNPVLSNLGVGPVNFGVLGKGLSLFGGKEAKEQGEHAERLKEIFSQINNVGRVRAAQLQAEGRELIKNLDLTEEQRSELDKMISRPKRATIQNRASSGISQLDTGLITRAQDIARVAQRAQKNINAGWARGSKDWRRMTVKNMTAQVRAIKWGMDASVISTKKGRDRITKIIRERKLTSGEDPVGIAAAYAKSWAKTREITPRQINRMKKDLGKMPKAAREQAIDAMEQMAQGLVRKGKLPERELAKLQSGLAARFGRTGKQAFRGLTSGAASAFDGLKKLIPKALGDVASGIASGMAKANQKTQDGSKRASKSLKGLADDANRFTGRIRKSFTGMPAPVAGALTAIAGYSNETAEAFGSSKRISLGFRRGGVARRRFRDGGVLAAVSSQEVLRFPDGRWARVSGPRVAADNVLTALPPDTEVYTDSGQQLLAAGFSRQTALDHQLPHFADGGKVPHGRLAGGANVARQAGQKTIDMGVNLARKWIRGLNPINPASIVTVGRSLQRLGYEVGEHPAFGGVAPVHTDGSYHYRGRAIDVNDDISPRGGSEATSLTWLAGKLRKIPHVELLWQTAGHYDHLHFAMRNGGRIPRHRVVKGKVSWFNGPASTTASGTPVSRPGLALNLRPGTTSAGWDNPTTDRWMKLAGEGHPVYGKTTIKGHTANLPIIDKGPHESTGRAIDVTEAGVRKLGFTTSNFPTDASGRVVIGGKPARSREPKSKTITIVRDDLKRIGARQARWRVPRMAKGFQHDAFSTAFEAGRLPHSVISDAIERARVAITRTEKEVSAAAGGASRKQRVVRRMQAYGDRVARRRLPYQYGGGHGKLGVGTPSFDCSGLVSGILGAGGFIEKPMVVAQGTGLYTLGVGGKGKYVTWGVRGSSGKSAHTMIRVGSKYYEASSEGVGRRSGWSGSFAKRHIRGWASGGRVGRKRPGSMLVQGTGFGRMAATAGALLPFGGGRFSAREIGGIGQGTGKAITKLFTAGNRENKQVVAALSRLGRLLQRTRKYSVTSLVHLQGRLEKVIRRTIDPKGPGGRAVTKAEAAMIRRARSTIDIVQGALGAKAGQRNRQANRIGAKGDQYRFDRDLTMRRRGIDASSAAGAAFERQTLRGEEKYLRAKRRQQRKALAIARRAGDKKSINELKQALKETSNAIAENAVSQVEKTRELVLAQIEEGRAGVDFNLGMKDLDASRVQAIQRLQRRDETPEAKLEQAAQMSQTIAALNAKRLAERSNAWTLGLMGKTTEAQQALTAYKEAEVRILETLADQAQAQREAVLAIAQRSTDIAAFGGQMQNVAYERVQLEQRLAGTFETGGAARRDFILQNIVPSLTAELAAMTAQLEVIVKNGDDEQKRQQQLAIAQKQNEILQAQLEAQEAIKENTDPKSIGGTTGFQYGGETLTDQLILMGNGS